MPTKNDDLHGNVPETAATVLLIIDMISDFEFKDGEVIFERASAIAPAIAELKRRAKFADIPVIYVNDNFGRWQSNFEALVRRCTQADVRGRPIARLLRPDDDDYSVLKPKHSAFYATTLELLLKHFKAERLILSGVAGNICVLFTASDAYMRDYALVVPSDCVASRDSDDNEHALKFMRDILDADIRPSTELNLDQLAHQPVDESEDE